MKSKMLTTICLALITGCNLPITVAVDKSVINDTISGQTLVDLGKEVDEPFLKLIGKIIIKLENEISTRKDERVIEEICRLHNCTDWNEWSRCDTRKFGEFGSRNRSRTCGFNTILCTTHSAPKVESESEVCESIKSCPNTYTKTKHGFCIKLYLDKKNRHDAEKVCLHDGGYLVNIDSATKVQDINETLTKHFINYDGVWIDGIRSEGSKVWKYSVEPTDASFTFWEQNEPHLIDRALCKVYFFHPTLKRWRWHDGACSVIRYFICQIITQ